MKPEDQAAFEDAFKEFLKNYRMGGNPLKDCAEGLFKAALAHRDAQPAVAVNEQLLDALNETQRDLTILLGNIFASSQRDKNWEGMYDVVNGWITRNHKSITAAEAAKEAV